MNNSYFLWFPKNQKQQIDLENNIAGIPRSMISACEKKEEFGFAGFRNSLLSKTTWSNFFIKASMDTLILEEEVRKMI